jgi:hypothetical protein
VIAIRSRGYMDALAEPYQLAALALLLIISHQIKTASF